MIYLGVNFTVLPEGVVLGGGAHRFFLQVKLTKRKPTNLQLSHFESCRFYNGKHPKSMAYKVWAPPLLGFWNFACSPQFQAFLNIFCLKKNTKNRPPGSSEGPPNFCLTNASRSDQWVCKSGCKHKCTYGVSNYVNMGVHTLVLNFKYGCKSGLYT
jgi:hypothetical protein